MSSEIKDKIVLSLQKPNSEYQFLLAFRLDFYTHLQTTKRFFIFGFG